MRRIDLAGRRARLAAAHHLGGGGSDVVAAARAVVGLHSSDAMTVVLGAWARVADVVVEDLEAALYEERTLVRILGMRRTLFVVPTDLAPVVHAACTRHLEPAERRRTVTLLEDAGITDDGASWLAAVERDVLDALDDLGPAVASELTEAVPELALRIPYGQGKAWAGEQGVSTRVLFLLATAGRIVRARPRGTVKSTQYRWARTDRWFDLDLDGLETQPARRDLARAYLRAYGPVTTDDVRWWTGWTVAATRAALADAGAVEVEAETGPGVVAPAWLDPEDPEVGAAPTEPWVALLPGLDPTVMGWRERGFYLGDHGAFGATLFDRNGNAGPTVWSDGRVVGGWAQRPDGTVAVRMLEDVGGDASDAIAAAAGRLEAWLGDTRFVPRFRTPLERELSG